MTWDSSAPDEQWGYPIDEPWGYPVAVGKLEIVPCKLCHANEFIATHHRHHRPHRFGTFAIGLTRGGAMVAVSVVGNPSARMLADGFTQEVTRLCSIDHVDGWHASGSCSKLYAACWRAARALGYRRLITYTLPEEGGASLRGAGWKLVGEAGGGTWSRDSRQRENKHPLQRKHRWQVES